MVLLMSLSVAGLSFLRSVRQSVTSFLQRANRQPVRSSPSSLGAGETRNLPEGVAASFALPTPHRLFCVRWGARDRRTLSCFRGPR
jgi:hypothetical protein